MASGLPPVSIPPDENPPPDPPPEIPLTRRVKLHTPVEPRTEEASKSIKRVTFIRPILGERDLSRLQSLERRQRISRSNSTSGAKQILTLGILIFALSQL